MLRLALSRVESRAVAEEVVQEAWLTVLRSLGSFERRSSLRTWVLGIVVNCARSRARAERRFVAVPSDAEPAVEEISLSMPNLHRVLVDLSPFDLDNPNVLFVPTDEPHGSISAGVRRERGE